MALKNNLVDKCIIFYLVNNNEIHLRRLFNSLKLLKQNFLDRYPYPVVLGVEEISDDIKVKIKNIINTQVYFYNIKFELPNYADNIKEKIPLKFKGHWDKSAFFSLGYRHMCRFFAGDIFNQPFFSNVKYFMRMDCDSYFTGPINEDLFLTMHNKNLKYITTGEEEDMDYVIEGLYSFCTNYFLNKKNIKYNGMFKTHFEIIDFQWFKSGPYKQFFDEIDKTGNIYIKRWGDAPIRYQGINNLVVDKEIFTANIPYKHGGDIIL